jgi:hypothetical protein
MKIGCLKLRIEENRSGSHRLKLIVGKLIAFEVWTAKGFSVHLNSTNTD